MRGPRLWTRQQKRQTGSISYELMILEGKIAEESIEETDSEMMKKVGVVVEKVEVVEESVEETDSEMLGKAGVVAIIGI